VRHARAHLTHPDRSLLNLSATPRILLNAEQMYALPHAFRHLPDPRRAQGRRHPLPVVPALAAGAILCGMRGYQAIHQWAESLGQLAEFLVTQGAHYPFTAKGNQPTLERDIGLVFAERQAADFTETDAGHGRIETRRIGCSTQLNDYLDFPHVGQVFLIEREVIQKKPARSPVKSRSASPAGPLTKPRPNAC